MKKRGNFRNIIFNLCLSIYVDVKTIRKGISDKSVKLWNAAGFYLCYWFMAYFYTTFINLGFESQRLSLSVTESFKLKKLLKERNCDNSA